MIAARAERMRNATPVLLLLLLSGCGADAVSLEGTLADGGAAVQAWVAGSDARATVEGGAFRLDAVPRDGAVIGFAREGADTSWMRLGPIGSGGTLRMSAIRFADGLAFPAAIEGPDGPVEVNGLRIGGADAIPGELNVAATVLAVSGEGDALLIRPAEGALPDLNVVLTPAAVVQTVDGDPVDAEGLEFGDSLRVSGVGQGAYLVASEVTVPRRVARSGGDADEPAPTPEVRASADGGGAEPEEEGRGLLDRVLGRRGNGGEAKGKGAERGKGKGRD